MNLKNKTIKNWDMMYFISRSQYDKKISSFIKHSNISGKNKHFIFDKINGRMHEWSNSDLGLALLET